MWIEEKCIQNFNKKIQRREERIILKQILTKSTSGSINGDYQLLLST